MGKKIYFKQKFNLLRLIAIMFVAVFTIGALPISEANAGVAITSDSVKDSIIIEQIMSMTNGFQLMNKRSGRMMNLKKGSTYEGAIFDTYKSDGSKTERFYLSKTNKGYQLKTGCDNKKYVDVTTNGRGTPQSGDVIGLYTPTNDDCSFWRIRYCGYDEEKGVYINIESNKTPCLYIGHPTNDKDGTLRKSLVLSGNGSADYCQWYICDPNGKPVIWSSKEVKDDKGNDNTTNNNDEYTGNLKDKQAKIDEFLQKLYFANHPNSSTYNENDIGYFTCKLKACKHECCQHNHDGARTYSNSCNDCNAINIIKSEWFKKAFPDYTQKLKTWSNFAGGSSGGKSCVGFSFTVADYLVRTADKDVYSKRVSKPSDMTTLDFFKNYVQSGDVIRFGSDPDHQVIVYACDFNSKNPTVTLVESNMDKRHHCFVRKVTVAFKDYGYMKYRTIERWRYIEKE